MNPESSYYLQNLQEAIQKSINNTRKNNMQMENMRNAEDYRSVPASSSGGKKGFPNPSPKGKKTDKGKVQLDPSCMAFRPRLGQSGAVPSMVSEYVKKEETYCPFFTSTSICLNGSTCRYVHDYRREANIAMQIDYLIGSLSSLKTSVENLSENQKIITMALSKIMPAGSEVSYHNNRGRSQVRKRDEKIVRHKSLQRLDRHRDEGTYYNTGYQN